MQFSEKQSESAGSTAKGAPSQQSLSTLILSDLNCPQYSIEQVKSCAKCFNQLATLIQKSKLQNIVKKFKTAKFFEVARIINNCGTSTRVINGSST